MACTVLPRPPRARKLSDLPTCSSPLSLVPLGMRAQVLSRTISGRRVWRPPLIMVMARFSNLMDMPLKEAAAYHARRSR